ncbi:hypothetical protein, partial [Clostridioides difficile]|uniref:hypothetical protein n=1 Tax=Clostridioides difficile TaxID=1496 RepID=UPI001A92D212
MLFIIAIKYGIKNNVPISILTILFIFLKDRPIFDSFLYFTLSSISSVYNLKYKKLKTAINN